jgi:Lon protease-like protein
MTLPEALPLFPLPNVVLFPRMPLPLHVFEPRYRAMVHDALRGPRLIGMVLLRGEGRADHTGRPSIFDTGTVGEIGHLEELADGRFNLVLRGIRTFTVRGEEPAARAYRVAGVTWREDVDDLLVPGMRETITGLVRQHLARPGRRAALGETLGGEVDDTTFVNFFAQHLDLDPLERQALLEESATSARGARLIEVLEFRLAEVGSSGGPPQGRAH